MIKNEKRLELDETFKLFQENINRKATYEEGVQDLLKLRSLMMDLEDNNSYESELWNRVAPEAFSLMPLKKDKTIAYFLYHLARIEDITSSVLIAKKDQVFYSEGFQNSLNTPITTTGNELVGEDIAEFSKHLNLNQLKEYRKRVYQNTNVIIQSVNGAQGNTKVSKEDINKILLQNSVSTDPNAIWLLDYWGSKTYIGLMLMPFSRHQMLHLNGCYRIMEKLGY